MDRKITATGLTYEDIILAESLTVEQLIGLNQDNSRKIIVDLVKKLRESQQNRYLEKQPISGIYTVCENCEQIECTCDYKSQHTIKKEITCCFVCGSQID